MTNKMTTQSDTNKKWVLLVEDEPVINRMCNRILTLEGFNVDVAYDGITASQASSEKHYDICVCDIRMPGLTGIQLFKHWRTNNSHLGSRTIFMTGDTLSKEVQEFLIESGAPYIMKPFSPDDLVIKVKELLG